MKAEIWTKVTCPWCVKAKEILTELKIPFNEFVVGDGSTDPQPTTNQKMVTRAQLLERLPTAKTVPQIWIDGKHIGGCTDLQAKVKSGEVK
jgi:glutaredoxin 3